ncbi:MAG: GTP-binding signal recognition particle G-domain protein, partial [Solirubrobacterales bacterium]|nr:GTP-binding signal recognition particle G-domain protein [Solirubrobacterales bacterium]
MTADSPYEQHPDAQSFSGTSLEEVLPQIRATLGADAVILDRRDGVEGGVAGFFGRRSIVVDACAARPRLDVRDEDQDAEPGESAPAPVPYGLDSYAATALPPAAAPVAAPVAAAVAGPVAPVVVTAVDRPLRRAHPRGPAA